MSKRNRGLFAAVIVLAVVLASFVYPEYGSAGTDSFISQRLGDGAAVGISMEEPYYEMGEGETLDIKAILSPEDSTDKITYTSSNTNIATVDENGKVTAVSAGNTYIIVTAASGPSTIANVYVRKAGLENSVDITLNVMFGTKTANITEKSEPITVKEDGQYTLTYDMAENLSEAGKAAGFTKMENLVSVYLRDANEKVSVVGGAKVRYDKVVLNDTELTLVKTKDMDKDGFKSLLKANGQLDSNDPVNGWDGSAVEEVGSGELEHTVNFTGVENPTKISVTFTIKDLKFLPVSQKTKPAISLRKKDDILVLAKGATQDLDITMNPAESDSEVTFYSTNTSVVSVDNKCVTVDSEGKIKTTLTAVGEGIATVVGICENGVKTLYTVAVGDYDPDLLDFPDDPTPPGLDGKVVLPTPTPVPSTPTPTPVPGAQNTSAPGGQSTPAPNTPAPGTQSTPAPNTPAPGTQNTPGGDDSVGRGGQEGTPMSEKVKVKKVSLKKVKSSKKKTITVQWKKLSSVSGYKIQVCTKKNFKKGVKKYTVKSAKTTKKTIKKLKSKKKYYVRICAYKKANGKTYTGKWSSPKKVKVK